MLNPIANVARIYIAVLSVIVGIVTNSMADDPAPCDCGDDRRPSEVLTAASRFAAEGRAQCVIQCARDVIANQDASVIQKCRAFDMLMASYSALGRRLESIEIARQYRDFALTEWQAGGSIRPYVASTAHLVIKLSIQGETAAAIEANQPLLDVTVRPHLRRHELGSIMLTQMSLLSRSSRRSEVTALANEYDALFAETAVGRALEGNLGRIGVLQARFPTKSGEEYVAGIRAVWARVSTMGTPDALKAGTVLINAI
jgi:hypothetical protein